VCVLVGSVRTAARLFLFKLDTYVYTVYMLMCLYVYVHICVYWLVVCVRQHVCLCVDCIHMCT